MLWNLYRYIRTKIFRKFYVAPFKFQWKDDYPETINWDALVEDAAQRLSDQIDIDVLDNVYKQVEESALYWAKMKEKEVELQLKMGKTPQMEEWPMFTHEVIEDGNPYTQVVSQCVIGQTKIRLDTNFKT
jgi:hypothetical protein